jgi:hypothetical protein
MKRSLLVVAVLIPGVSLFLTVGAGRAGAQGPAGAGASTAAQGNSGSSGSKSGHSLNPIKWVKKDKDSKNSPDSNGSRSDTEKKLTPKLQTQGLLPANANATDACAPFVALHDCLAVLHVSHNLGLEFNCLRAGVTGVHTSADLSGCKMVDGEKALSLYKAIHQLKPDANAKEATKNAEQQAKDDLKDLGA